jgi:hypothetical protein
LFFAQLVSSLYYRWYSVAFCMYSRVLILFTVGADFFVQWFLYRRLVIC